MTKLLFILLTGTHGVQRSLERLLVILIIGILASALIYAYHLPANQARVLNGLSFGLEQFKREIACYWALHGAWPPDAAAVELFADSEAFKKESANHIEKAEIENGALHVSFKKDKKYLAGRILTCRPAVLGKNPTGTVIWGCGAMPPASIDWSPAGPDRTTIDFYFIPRSLRYD